MENTGKMLFGQDTTPKWFVAIGDQSVGPMTAAEVYDKITAGQITWVHFVWTEGQGQWSRICDTPTFQVAVPKAPTVRPVPPSAGAKKAPPPPIQEPKPWYLYYNDTQFGPFAQVEVERYLKIGKLNGRVHAWKDGMEGWVRLENLPEFSQAVTGSGPARSGQTAIREAAVQQFGLDAAPGAVEKRTAPRFPLVARLLVADSKAAGVTVALCRDISIGGMQVLTDRIPGPVGTQLKLNVSPSSASPKKSGSKKSARVTIEAFVAEGEIVRILEDGRGYSFRFKKLPEKSRKAIEKYIRETQSEADEE
jgi:hypothetical protein